MLSLSDFHRGLTRSRGLASGQSAGSHRTMCQTINHKILGEFCITLDGYIDYTKGSNAIPTDTVII